MSTSNRKPASRPSSAKVKPYNTQGRPARPNSAIKAHKASRVLRSSNEDILELKDAKMLLPIYAYNPKALKKCLVNDQKSYTKFYNQNGYCGLELFNTPFLSHFRSWRSKLEKRITEIIDKTVESTSYEEAVTKQILNQFLQLAQELQNCIKAITSSKQPISSKAQFNREKAKFEAVKKYIDHIQQVLKKLFQFIEDINRLMEEGEDDEARALTQKIKKLTKKYEMQIVEDLQYCYQHPLSNQANQAEIKLKRKFDEVQRWALDSLKRMQKMKCIKKQFEINISKIMSQQEDPEYYTVPVLQDIVDILNANDEFRLNNRDILEGPPSKALQTICRLNQQIEVKQRDFLIKFKFKAHMIIKSEHDKLKNETVLASILNQGQSYKIAKKKLLLLSKIYNRNQDLQYHENLNNCISATSEHFDTLKNTTDLLISISQDKKYQGRNKVVQVIKQLHEFLLLFQKCQSSICQCLLEAINYPGDPPGTRLPPIKDSDRFELLLTIMQTSGKETDCLTTPAYRPTSEGVSQDMVKKVISTNNDSLRRMMDQKMPIMLKYSKQLTELSEDELVKHLLLFEEDLNKEPVHSFKIVRDFHRALYPENSTKTRQITREVVVKMIAYFNDTMAAAEAGGFRNLMALKEYLQWMFENRVASYLLDSMLKLRKTIGNPANKTYQKNGGRSKSSYANNELVRSQIGQMQLVFKEIVTTSYKYVQKKSIFDIYFSDCLNQIEQFQMRQKIYMEFRNSKYNSIYYPSRDTLENWLSSEFAYCVLEQMETIQIKAVRNDQRRSLEGMNHKLTGLAIDSASKYDLGKQFVEECKREIYLITQLLLPCAEATDSLNIFQNQPLSKVQHYEKVIKNITLFMRENDIFFIGICTKNEKPITFLSQGSASQLFNLLGPIQKKLGMAPESIQRSNAANILIPFIPKQIEKDILEMRNRQKILSSEPKNIQAKQISPQKQNEPCFILDQVPPHKQSKKSKLKEQGFILDDEEVVDEEVADEVYDEVFEEEGIQEEDKIGEQSKEAMFILPGSQAKQPMFILPGSQKKVLKMPYGPNKHVEGNVEKHESQEDDVIEIEQNKTFYLKLLQLENLQVFKSCLEFNNLEYSVIKKQLTIGKLALALNPNQPNPQLVASIDKCLLECSAKTILSIFNSVNKYSKSQITIMNFKESLNYRSKADRIEKLSEVLHLLGFSYETVWGQVMTQDFIVLFDIGQKDRYAHALLTNQNCVEHPIIPMNQLKKVQLLFLDSLFTLPFENNKNLDQIRATIQTLNSQAADKYKGLKQSILKYKEFPLENGQQINEYVDKYVSACTNGQKTFTQVNKVTFDAHQIFLKEAAELGCSFGEQLCQFSCGEQEGAPTLCLSEGYQSMKTMLQEASIIPSMYNTPKYVQRNNLNSVVFRYDKLQKDLIAKQLESEFLTKKYLLDVLLDPTSLSSKGKQDIERQDRETEKILTQSGDKYEKLINYGKVTSQRQLISSKLQQLQNKRIIARHLLANIPSVDSSSVDEDVDDQKRQEEEFECERTGSKRKKPMSWGEIEKVQKLLKSIDQPYKLIKYESKLVGICLDSLPAQEAIKSIISCGKNYHIPFVVKELSTIKIQSLPIFLAISQNYSQILKQYSLEIRFSGVNMTINPLSKLADQPQQLEIGYPPNKIDFYLKKTNSPTERSGLKKNELTKTTSLKYYEYGNKYTLAWVEDIIEEAKEQKRKREQSQKQRLQEEQRLRKIAEAAAAAAAIEQLRKREEQKKRRFQQQEEERRARIRAEQEQIERQRQRIDKLQKQHEEAEKMNEEEKARKIKMQQQKKRRIMNKLLSSHPRKIKSVGKKPSKPSVEKQSESIKKLYRQHEMEEEDGNKSQISVTISDGLAAFMEYREFDFQK